MLIIKGNFITSIVLVAARFHSVISKVSFWLGKISFLLSETSFSIGDISLLVSEELFMLNKNLLPHSKILLALSDSRYCSVQQKIEESSPKEKKHRGNFVPQDKQITTAFLTRVRKLREHGIYLHFTTQQQQLTFGLRATGGFLQQAHFKYM